MSPFPSALTCKGWGKPTGNIYYKRPGAGGSLACTPAQVRACVTASFLPTLALHPQSMLRNQRTSLQELYSHESFLSKLNQELIKSIQDMEDSMAMTVRAMLQQQGILGVSHLLPSASLLLVQTRPLLATPDPCLRNAVPPFVPTYQPGDFGLTLYLGAWWSGSQ